MGIACALEALNAEDDPQDGPGLLLEQLALALGSPHLCLCPLSWPSPGEEPIFRGEPSPLERLVRAPRATSYLARRPFRAIALTGRGGAEDRAAATRAGFDAHVAKPIDASILVAVARETIRSKKAG